LPRCLMVETIDRYALVTLLTASAVTEHPTLNHVNAGEGR
jgi:hypothetical protein